ncbi:plasmid mobilization relaxosome protein MobC [Paucibacter soli]|uniref:plasmid mobilization relaxosome protein MobC n=1 Tax=Paucibacter soli TaxID=3133433 RepID=UPI0030AB2755
MAWDSEAARAGMSRSDWLRQAVDPERARLTGARQPKRLHRTADPALLFQIGRAGTLLNQLAHQANGAAIAGSKADVLQTLFQIERHLDELLHREGVC